MSRGLTHNVEIRWYSFEGMQPGSRERVHIDIAKCPFSVNCVAERRDGRVYIHCVFDGALTALIHFATSKTIKNIRDKFF